MIPDINDFTWQSLYEYIERRIAGTQRVIQIIKENTHPDELSQRIKGSEHQLELLQWCIPLVKELQTRESLQNICPIMSLEIIRLRCRHKTDGQVYFSDFAWILPIADGRFNIRRIESQKSEDPQVEDMQLFEGNLGETLEKVEELAKEICIKE
jgi:hypothetical protein